MKDIIKSILLSAEKYSSSILIALSYFLLAQNIEPSLLGELSVIESLAIIFSFSSLISLDAIVLDKALKSKGKTEQYFVSSYLLKIAFSLFGYFIFILVSSSVFSYSTHLSMLIGCIIVFKTGVILQLRFIAKDKIVKSVIYSIIATVVSFILKLLLVYYDKDEFFALFFILDSFMVFLIFTLCSLKHITRMNIVFSEAYRILRDGALFVFSSFTILAFGKVDQVILSKLMTYQDVANYALSMKVIGSFVLISNAFNLVFARNVSIAKIQDKDTYLANVRHMMRFTFIVGAVLSGVNYFFSPLLLNFLYDDKYPESIEIVKIASPLILLVFLSSSVGKVLITENLGKFALIRNLSSLLLICILSIFLIPSYGLQGAVVAAILSWLTSSLLLVIIYKKTRFIFLR